MFLKLFFPLFLWFDGGIFYDRLRTATPLEETVRSWNSRQPTALDRAFLAAAPSEEQRLVGNYSDPDRDEQHALRRVERRKHLRKRMLADPEAAAADLVAAKNSSVAQA